MKNLFQNTIVQVVALGITITVLLSLMELSGANFQ